MFRPQGEGDQGCQQEASTWLQIIAEKYSETLFSGESLSTLPVSHPLYRPAELNLGRNHTTCPERPGGGLLALRTTWEQTAVGPGWGGGWRTGQAALGAPECGIWVVVGVGALARLRCPRPPARAKRMKPDSCLAATPVKATRCFPVN